MSENRTPDAVAPEMTEQQLSEVLQVRRDKLATLVENGQDPFTITKYEVTAYTDEARAAYEAKEAQYIAENGQPEEGQSIEFAEPIQVSMAGRMMSRRIMGKASFLDLHDANGRVQVYVSRGDVGAYCPVLFYIFVC